MREIMGKSGIWFSWQFIHFLPRRIAGPVEFCHYEKDLESEIFVFSLAGKWPMNGQWLSVTLKSSLRAFSCVFLCQVCREISLLVVVKASNKYSWVHLPSPFFKILLWVFIIMAMSIEDFSDCTTRLPPLQQRRRRLFWICIRASRSQQYRSRPYRGFRWVIILKRYWRNVCCVLYCKSTNISQSPLCWSGDKIDWRHRQKWSWEKSLVLTSCISAFSRCSREKR